jgi:DMSO/TMAO reductase YedYZ molybdopterin-dependent catalytic subunit
LRGPTSARNPITRRDAFERSLPLAKALHPDTLLAFRMNGEVRDPIHGYPLRLFVPGWYGVASVKWLRRIEVVNEPFRGYFQSVKYTVQRRNERGVESEIVGPMMPKSEIIRPRAEANTAAFIGRIACSEWRGPARIRSAVSRSAPTAARPGATQL